MSINHLSSIATVVLCQFLVSFADPVLLTEWNWNDGNGLLHEYEAYLFPNQSWEAANQTNSDGWHLATITSENEQVSLISGLRGVTGEYWLGAYQTGENKNPADDWAWITGEAWNYKNWAPGEPNDAHGGRSEQHLAVWSNWGTTNWLWNDEGYLPNMTGYITERTQSVPEPATLFLLVPAMFALFGISKIRGI